MTQNQLRYQELQLKGKELGETQRHNYATEEVASGSLAETSRHNVAGEGIDLTKAMESIRHNQAVEGYESMLAGARTKLAETQQLTEYEKARTQAAQADIARTSANYAEAREILNIAQGVTQAGKNVADIVKPLGSLIGGGGSSLTPSGLNDIYGQPIGGYYSNGKPAN